MIASEKKNVCFRARHLEVMITRLSDETLNVTAYVAMREKPQWLRYERQAHVYVRRDTSLSAGEASTRVKKGQQNSKILWSL